MQRQSTTINPTKRERIITVSAFFGLFILCFAGMFIFAKNKEYNPIPVIRNNPGRTVNTSFVSTPYRATIASYTVNITTTLGLLNLNSSGVVYLEISPDNATWTTVNSAGVTKTLAVSISVGLNETASLNVQGVIPPNWYCRLRTVVSGGATATYMYGQETMY